MNTRTMYGRPEALGLFGAPGVGKDTNQEAIIRAFPGAFYCIGTGEMLRDVVERNVQPLAGAVQSYLTTQRLVPDEIINAVVKDRTAYAIASGQFEPDEQRIIYNGYPRTAEQAKFLDSLVHVGAVIHLRPDINGDADPWGVLVDRIYQRAAKLKERGQKYRAGDLDRDAVFGRMSEYREVTQNIIDHYRKNGTKVHDINAMRSLDEVKYGVLAVTREILGRGRKKYFLPCNFGLEFNPEHA